MSLKNQYKLWMDELHNRIKTDLGYTFADYDEELRTPKKKSDGSYYYEGLDEIKLPSEFDESGSIDELRVQNTPTSAQNALRATEANNTIKSTAETQSPRKKPYDDEYLEYLIFLGNEEEAENASSEEPGTGKRKAVSAEARKKFDDDLLEFLIFMYGNGVDACNDMLHSNITPDDKEMEASILHKTAGKGYQQRLDEYYSTGNISAIVKVAETEAHRVFEDGIENSGRTAGARQKTWATMMDDRVRDTHWYLEGVTVPFEEKFYTFDGDSAMKPGGFDLPENNINCRCYLELSY